MQSFETSSPEEKLFAVRIETKNRLNLISVRDSISEKLVFLLTTASAIVIVFIFIFIVKEAAAVLQVNSINFVTTSGFDQQIINAYNAPADKPIWQFGALGLLLGTLTTTLGALLLAVPMGMSTAIVITELAPVRLRYILRIVIRLLASIPSVIYGLIGLMVVVPFIQELLISSELQIRYIDRFQLAGNSMLAGIVVLSIMIVPIIAALAVDAINAVPHHYKEAALALGISHWGTILRVILPAAKSGILAGIILSVGRAVGEAIALSMVSGGIGNIPQPGDGMVFFLTPVLTLASAIVNKSEIMSVPTIEAALFACGLVLLVTCVGLSLCARLVEYLVKRGEGRA